MSEICFADSCVGVTIAARVPIDLSMYERELNGRVAEQQ